MTRLIILNEEMNEEMNDVMKIVNPLKEYNLQIKRIFINKPDFITFISLLAKHLKMKQEATREFLGMC